MLVGNPNVGKSVLFNNLTSSNQRVGNWHGVTVDYKTAQADYNGTKINITDLPGCYNLSGYSAEEKLTASFIKTEHKVINVCDINNLERNLYLTILLLEKGYNVLLFINSYQNNGAKLNTKKLSKELGIDIVVSSAKKVTVEQLVSCNFKSKKQSYNNEHFVDLDFAKKVALRYKYIEELLNICEYKKATPRVDFDKVILNKFFAIPIFLFIVACMFFVCFGPIGQFITSCFNGLIQRYVVAPINNELMSYSLPEPLYRLVIDGIVEGCLAIFAFLPQIVLVDICICILEDSGYLSRIAFLFEGVFAKVGLSGKSIFSLLVSFGCNTTAIFSTKGQENKKDRIKLCFFIPYICCSAKLPIFVIFSNILCKKYGVGLIFLFYLLSICVGLCILTIFKALSNKMETNSLILESPRYSVVSFKKCLKNSLLTAKSFLYKVSTTIFLANILIWFLQNFDFSFAYNTGQSMLKTISQLLSPIFAPIGLNNWTIVCSLVVGVVAKELCLSTLAVTNGVAMSDLSLCLIGGGVANFSPLIMFVYVIFVSMYCPCISTIAAISKELGKKYATLFVLVNIFVTYSICCVLRFVGLIFFKYKTIFIIVLLILVVIVAFFTRKKCRDCAFCKNKKCGKYTK